MIHSLDLGPSIRHISDSGAPRSLSNVYVAVGFFCRIDQSIKTNRKWVGGLRTAMKALSTFCGPSRFDFSFEFEFKRQRSLFAKVITVT